jgi:hypothetical protein
MSGVADVLFSLPHTAVASDASGSSTAIAFLCVSVHGPLGIHFLLLARPVMMYRHSQSSTESTGLPQLPQ